jgi:hypothetical protein
MGLGSGGARVFKVGLRAAVLGAAGLLLAGASGASASVIGQAVTPGAATSCGVPQGALQTAAVPGGNPFAVAVPGVLTSFATRAYNPGGPGTHLRLVVYRPAGGANYTVVGVSDKSITLPTTAPAADLTSAMTPIPVQPGDIVGFWTDGTACALATGNAGDTGAYVVSAAPPTGTVATGGYDSYVTSISATFAPLCNGLPANVGCWHFDEPSGTTAYDSSGLGNNGTYVGGPVLGAAGLYNSAVTMDGVNDYVRVPDSASLHVGDTFTLFGYIRRTSDAKSQELFNKGANGFQLSVMSAANGNQVWLRKAGVSTIAKSTIGVPADGLYHQVVAIKNGTGPGTTTILVDGTGGTTDVAPVQQIKDTAFPLTFGLVGGGAVANFDEFAIYDASAPPV